MASTDVATTHMTLPVRDAASGTRFFSRLARSPTGRKHQPTTSLTGPNTDTNTDLYTEQLPSLPTSSHSHHHPPPQRPVFGRNHTAPHGTVTLFVSPDISSVGSHSDGKADHATQSAAQMLDIGLSAAMLRPPPQTAGKSTVLEGSQAVPVASVGPNYQYLQIQELAVKRMATLDYMRRAHDGKRFWFNAVHLSKNDISKLPAYASSRLSRRAMNYLLLGLSIPVVLDVHSPPHPGSPAAANAASALELLRSLNTLFGEFETYQALHPVDGSHVSSLSRARIPQMFKRAATTSRPRKSSGTQDFGPPSQISPPAIPDGPYHVAAESTYSSSTFASSTPTLVNGSPATPLSGGNFPTSSSFPPPGPSDAPNSTILPNEGPYTYLLTPSLPFAPDFYSVFSTLSDALTEVYQRLLQLINTPSICSNQVMEAFFKADARIRKIMVGGIIRDFEGHARETAKKELMGVQKVVLGGLMGA